MSQIEEDVAKAMMRACNGRIGEMVNALADTIVHEHRYIQGEVISALCRVLYKIAETHTGTDDRNEHAITLCTALAKISKTGTADAYSIDMIRRFFF